jgi:hypothetical protein
LWPVPDQVERFRDDPWTAEIPVVPPLHVVPDPVPRPSDLETTMMWHAVDGPMVPRPAVDAYEPVQRFDGYAPGYEPAPYEPEVHAPAGYDRYGYDSARYEAAGYESAGYEPAGYEPAGYDRYGYDSARYEAAGYEPAGYEPAVYDLAPYEPYQDVPRGRRPYDSGGYDSGWYDHGGYERAGYDPVKDTGRHHVRLAPAGW